ncbi:hypothetical protein I7I50_09295 [Histoplasma capsulatum G186AR]|uniref:Uncharacterized protein n=1 Tax=Ajellomyces capsulatus TaxID=5037 RepID=A0A8H7YPQ8_AJECA|nr:hypothetical protein I7I52_06816 [Histoplasma capsulatum]QSS74212.1 hypothetical protein I7I50_09295 [Histoplasma capsulatum G186AR]
MEGWGNGDVRVGNLVRKGCDQGRRWDGDAGEEVCKEQRLGRMRDKKLSSQHLPSELNMRTV